MLSLQHNSSSGAVGGSLVTIENSSPEVIHVVSASNVPQRAHSVAAVNSAIANMQTITISGGNLNFPLNLVVSPSLSSGAVSSSAQLITANLPTDLATKLKEVNQSPSSSVGIIDVAARIKVCQQSFILADKIIISCL